MRSVETPDRTTAAAFPRHSSAQVIADSTVASVVGHLRAASPLPARGRSLSRARQLRSRTSRAPSLGQRSSRSAMSAARGSRTSIGRGDIFVTRSRVPYEVRFSSPAGGEIEVISMHLAVDQFLAAVEAVYPGNARRRGGDRFLRSRRSARASVLRLRGDARAACSRNIEARGASRRSSSPLAWPRNTRCAAASRRSSAAACRSASCAKWRTFVGAHLAEDVSVESLAELVELSPVPLLARV